MSSTPERAGASRRELALLFALALGLRLAALALVASADEALGKTPWAWGQEPACLADSLERGDGYGDPFARATGPSAWLTPVYPGLLALLFRIFGGVSPGAAGALFALQALASALTAVGLVALGRALGQARVGRVAGWLFALHPVGLWYAIHQIWDASFVAAALVGFWTLCVRTPCPAQPRHCAWLGAAFGAILLLNPAPVGILPVVLLYLTLGGDARAVAQRALAFGVVMLAVVSPWMLRNQLTLGTFGMRSNLGVELRVGNNELADGMHRFEYHPGWNDDVTERLLELGEVEFASECRDEALAWMREHPADFAKVSGRRAQIFWIGEYPPHDRREFGGLRAGDDPKSWLKWLVHLAVGVLGVAGLAMMRVAPRERWFLGGILVLFPAPYYLTHSLERYRFPIEPLLVLGVATILVALFELRPKK